MIKVCSGVDMCPLRPEQLTNGCPWSETCSSYTTTSNMHLTAAKSEYGYIRQTMVNPVVDYVHKDSVTTETMVLKYPKE